jgi:membrane protease YdiL (CAAX protease family)
MARTMRPLSGFFLLSSILVLGVASYFAWTPGNGGTATFWMLAGGPSVVLGAVAIGWGIREDLLRQWLSPHWGDFTRGIVGAAAVYGAAWAFGHTVAPIGSPREIWLVSLYGQIGDPQQLRAHAPWVGAVIVVVAACEEIVWRGLVSQLLADRFGSRAAWLVAAALYALAYVPTMWALRAGAGLNPVLVIAALGGGLLWGAMARAFGGLVPSIVAHAFFDWGALMMLPIWGGHVEL